MRYLLFFIFVLYIHADDYSFDVEEFEKKELDTALETYNRAHALKVKDKEELLVFVTPQIVKDGTE